MKLLHLSWRNPALILILLGVCVLSLGFLNEISHIDIPPQDPPPAVAQKYARESAQEKLKNQRDTARFYQAGRLLLGIGLGIGFLQSVVRLTRRNGNH
jgi:hypothetical protein